VTTLTVEQRVAAGFAFFEAHRPGWWQVGTFSLQDFDLTDNCACVVGQLFDGDFNDAIEQHWLDLDYPEAIRFVLYTGDYDTFVALEDEWRRLVAARRAEQVTT